MAGTHCVRRIATLAGLGIAALVCAAGVAAQTAPALQGVVSYETRQVTKAGITRVETWQENMYRQGGTVWTERIVATSALAAHAAHDKSGKPEPGHKHLDIDTAARWLQKDSAGVLTLRYVDKHDNVVVSVPKAEFGAVGFDGRWDTAAYLVPPDLVAKMKPTGALSSNAVWRTEQAKDWTHRVFWSETRQAALQIESKKTDGSFSRTIRLKPSTTVASTAPWEKLSGFEQKKYDDYMD